MPKLSPLPLGVAVRVPVEPDTEAFHEFCRLCDPLRRIETRQSELPDTARATLNRSPHSWLFVTVTLHASDGSPPEADEQLAVGVAVLPLEYRVIPKLLPLPSGVAVSVPLVPATLAFHEFWRDWPDPVRMVTTHSSAPL